MSVYDGTFGEPGAGCRRPFADAKKNTSTDVKELASGRNGKRGLPSESACAHAHVSARVCVCACPYTGKKEEDHWKILLSDSENKG